MANPVGSGAYPSTARTLRTLGTVAGENGGRKLHGEGFDDAASARDRLVRILLRTKAFRFSADPIYPLASGVLSQYYIDCKLALSHPDAREIVGRMILDRVKSLSLDGVGGLIIGAYPIAIAVSDAAWTQSGKVIRAFVVRKEPKRHGLQKLIEGDVATGDKVLIVDDVITSGSSTLEAITKSRQEGLHVVKAVALIDRQEQDGRAKIEAEGVPFEALCTLADLKSSQALSEPSK